MACAFPSFRLLALQNLEINPFLGECGRKALKNFKASANFFLGENLKKFPPC